MKIRDPVCFSYNGRTWVALGGWLEKPKEERGECKYKPQNAFVLEKVGDETWLLTIENNRVVNRELLAKRVEGAWEVVHPIWRGMRCFAIYSDYSGVYCVDDKEFNACVASKECMPRPFSICEDIVTAQCLAESTKLLIGMA